MSDDDIVIEHGLPDDLRDQAVEIFEDAFGQKMRTVVRDAERRKRFMHASYVAKNCVIAQRNEYLI